MSLVISTDRLTDAVLVVLGTGHSMDKFQLQAQLHALPSALEAALDALVTEGVIEARKEGDFTVYRCDPAVLRQMDRPLWGPPGWH